MKFTSIFAFLALPFGILARELTQSGATWGLHAISHREPHARPWQTSLRRFEYYYDETAGEGTFAYVIDGGVRISHKELEGRAENLWTADRSPYPHDEPDYVDKTGHGTHIAGTIASKTYGVAKKARIVAVKVRDRLGRTSSSNLLSGIHRAVKDIMDKGRIGKAVINISLGVPEGCQERAVRQAIWKAVGNGITIVQASGNEGKDAKDFCLAPKARAITVGNMKPDWSVAEDSNFGTTVDLFGPGTDIPSLSSADDESVRLMSGTSMAAPHVAGVVLTFMSGSPKRSHEIRSLLDTTCTQDKIKGDLRGSPNKLVNNNNNKQGK